MSVIHAIYVMFVMYAMYSISILNSRSNFTSVYGCNIFNLDFKFEVKFTFLFCNVCNLCNLCNLCIFVVYVIYVMY